MITIIITMIMTIVMTMTIPTIMTMDIIITMIMTTTITITTSRRGGGSCWNSLCWLPMMPEQRKTAAGCGNGALLQSI